MKKSKEHTLILRSFDGEMTEDAERALKSLLVSSDSARAAHTEFSAVRHTLQQYGTPRFSDGFASRVMDAIQEPVAVANESQTSSLATIYALHGPRVLRLAAVILLLVAVSAIVWTQPRTYTVPYGKTVTRLLPDGTSVQLGSGSTLSFKPFWGRSTRLVQLEGEAFFDVTKTGKSFVVNTPNASIQVLGTRFNVKAWPEATDPQTTVTLEEGRVEIAALAAPDDIYELRPLQTAVIEGNIAYPARSVSTMDTLLAWRTGGLAFDNESLAAITAELERRYAVKLGLSDALQSKRITYLEPEPANLNALLNDITQAYGLAFRRTANGYEIFEP